jgi:hypothetical protein
MGNNALIWTFAGVIAATTFARGHAMTNTLHMFLWYTVGALILAGASLIWISLEPAILIQHRLVVGTLGALLGALVLLSVAEWMGPAKSQTPLTLVPSVNEKPPSSQPPPQSSAGKNSPNISAGRDVNIGHLGDVINGQPPQKYAGTLTAATTLLSASGGSTIAQIQIGQSGTYLISNDAFFQFPALKESQLKVESINGKIYVSSQITNSNGALIAGLIRNDWKVAPPPGTWDRNYSDDALEVKNPEGRIILQVRVLPDRIQLQGVWWTTFKNKSAELTLVQSPDPKHEGALVMVRPIDGSQPIVPIKPMFRYPSDLHLGELAQ